MTRERLSQAAQTEVLEYDITRRLVLCGMAGAAAASLTRPLQAQIVEPGKDDCNNGWHRPYHVAKLPERHRG
jgi:hypothetical protein